MIWILKSIILAHPPTGDESFPGVFEGSGFGIIVGEPAGQAAGAEAVSSALQPGIVLLDAEKFLNGFEFETFEKLAGFPFVGSGQFE